MARQVSISNKYFVAYIVKINIHFRLGVKHTLQEKGISSAGCFIEYPRSENFGFQLNRDII